MSDFLAEARLVVRPDTTRFRTELLAAVTAATRTPVPIAVTPVIAGGSRGIAQVTAQANVASGAVNQLAAAQLAAGAAATKTRSQIDAQTKTISALEKAAFASAAGMTGLRGAVLTAGGAFLAATVGIQAFGRAVQSAAQLESNLNVFRVTAGATADEMERVRDTAKALGRDLELPGVTANDAAQTFLTLSRAGLDVQDALAGARGTLQLATAAQISFTESAQLTASALNAFNLSGDSAVAVADTLTNAANASQASISEMGIALRQSAAIADLAGFSFSETSTFLTQLAQAGLAGSDAGTSFRVAIQRLIAPTDKAREVLEKLEVNLRDANENLRPEAFFELGEALERMGRAQADATRQTIFGNDASRAAAFFARINADAFREQEAALNRQGAAAEVAAARNEGFAGSVENLKNQVTALGIEIGEASIPALGVAADAAAVFFGALATQIADTREVFGGFNEDAEKIQQLFQESLDQGGFVEGFKAADAAVNDLLDDLDRVTGTDAFIDFLTGAGDSASATAPKIKRLSDEEKRLAEAIHDAVRPAVEQTTGLDDLAEAARRAAAAVSRLENQQRGLEEQTTRARISGDEDAEMASLVARRQNLEEELAKQEAIIARPGRKGDAAAREAIRRRILPQLEAVTNEIDNILRAQQTEAESLQRDRENAQDELLRTRDAADREFLAKLSSRRDDVDRAGDAAAREGNITRALRLEDRLQALIKQQIQKVRDQIDDEKARAAAVRELRLALIASRREEDDLRRQRAEDIAARKAEAISLDIDFAETIGNVDREIAARQRLIALLRKQQAAVKKGSNEWKRLRNAIAEQQQAIKEARDQADDNEDQGRSAQEFFFEQLQAQQGFAANLLGNLITGPTAGLVGTPSPATQAGGPGRGIQAAALQAEGQAGGTPTAGQVNTEINVLNRILEELKRLNGSYDAPEAINQKKSGAGALDYAAM